MIEKKKWTIKWIFFRCPMIFISNIDPPLHLPGFENRVLIVNAVNESGIIYLILSIKNLNNLIRFKWCRNVRFESIFPEHRLKR